jgi:glycosyltransferase involved in cell wall biosynthesis
MKKNILIILNKVEPSLSETFIKNHIDFFGAAYINVSEFKIKNIDFGHVYLNKILNKRIYKKYKRKIKSILLKNKPDLLLAEYGMVGAQISNLSKEFNIPLIVHFHGHDAHRKSVIESYLENYKQMFEVAIAIVVVSSKMKESLINLGAPSNKIFLNGYGVDISKFNYKERIRNDKFTLFSVGRFVDKKAPYLLILTFQKVLNTVPTAKLIIAGDGYLFETCSRMIKALHLENSIEVLGAIAHEEVVEYMNTSDVFVQHSVEAFDGDSEGLPNTILEAASSGIPIVSTPHAGIADVLKNKQNALLVPENDIDAMAEAIIELYNKPSLALDLAKNARKTIEDDYQLTHSLERLNRIIEKVLS